MFTTKRSIPRNADAAVMEKAMIAKLEQLLAEAKGEAPGEGPVDSEGPEQAEMGKAGEVEGGAEDEGCCPTCGQPLPMSPDEVR